jgi:hypothetical protein
LNVNKKKTNSSEITIVIECCPPPLLASTASYGSGGWSYGAWHCQGALEI